MAKDKQMKKEKIEAFAREAAKSIKTESDLNDFRQILTKITVEAALNAELDDHLGYEKHTPSANSNSRNGYSSKTLRTKMANLRLKHLVIVKAALSPFWSRNSRPTSLPWTTIFSAFMRKA